MSEKASLPTGGASPRAAASPASTKRERTEMAVVSLALALNLMVALAPFVTPTSDLIWHGRWAPRTLLIALLEFQTTTLAGRVSFVLGPWLLTWLGGTLWAVRHQRRQARAGLATSPQAASAALWACAAWAFVAMLAPVVTMEAVLIAPSLLIAYLLLLGLRGLRRMGHGLRKRVGGGREEPPPVRDLLSAQGRTLANKLFPTG